MSRFRTQRNNQGERQKPRRGLGNPGSVRNSSKHYDAQIASMVRERNVHAAEECLNQMASMGVRPTTSSFNLVINLHKSQGNMQQAELWLRKMLAAGVQPNSASFTTLVSGCEQTGDTIGAEKWYSAMLELGCEPTEQTYNAMISSYAKAGKLQQADEWLQRMQSLPSMVQPTTTTYNILIDAYSRAQQFDRAGFWFQELRARGLALNQSTVRAMVDFFMENTDEGAAEQPQAQHLFNASLEVADLSYSSLIKACSRRGEAEQAEKVLRHMIDQGHMCSMHTYNSMIHACTKIGDVARAERYFELMKLSGAVPDVITYNTLINTCAASGQANRASHWLLQMIEADLRPTEVTYGTICKVYARQGNPQTVKYIMDALESTGFKLNEYFYASWISAFGAAEPPDTAGAEAAFWDMVKKGLKVHNVRSVLTRVVGAKRSTKLAELSKRNVIPSANTTALAELPLSAHQHISEKLKLFIQQSEDVPNCKHRNTTSASSSSADRLYTPAALDLGPVSASDVPMPSFVSRSQPSKKRAEQFDSKTRPSQAVDASSGSASVSLPYTTSNDADLIEGQPSSAGTSSPGASANVVQARLEL